MLLLSGYKFFQTMVMAMRAQPLNRISWLSKLLLLACWGISCSRALAKSNSPSSNTVSSTTNGHDSAAPKSGSAYIRPPLVQDALDNGRNLYYFGLGSNMLRSKIENRGVNGTKIDLISMEAAVVKGHRLAFNTRGFPPLEPGMGALEPCTEASSRPLEKYKEDECHGALVLLTPDNYEKVMRSEGVNPENPPSNSGYEEVVVDAYPYKSPDRPVKAIALCIRAKSKLKRDAAPSQRYMNILLEGAAELGLKPCYQEFLATHPVQSAPKWLRRLAVYNLIFTFSVSTTLKTRIVSRVQAGMLYLFHRPQAAQQAVLNLCNAAVLMPGAAMGVMIQWFYTIRRKELPGMIPRLIKLVEETPPVETRK